MRDFELGTDLLNWWRICLMAFHTTKLTLGENSIGLWLGEISEKIPGSPCNHQNQPGYLNHPSGWLWLKTDSDRPHAFWRWYIYIYIHIEYFPQKAPMSWPPWLLLLWSWSSKYFRCKLCLHRYRQCTSWSRPPRLPKERWGEWVVQTPQILLDKPRGSPHLPKCVGQLQGFSGRSFFQLQGAGRWSLKNITQLARGPELLLCASEWDDPSTFPHLPPVVRNEPGWFTKIYHDFSVKVEKNLPW